MRTGSVSKVAILLLILCGVYFFTLSGTMWKFNTRRESVRILSAASSEDELKEAVKPYGVFVRARDSSWVAIRYRDSHSFAIRSLAVAKDSDGQWFTCNRHFCGWLPSFAKMRAEADADKLRRTFPASDDFKGQAGYERMEALFAASDLNALREALRRMDFKTINAK